MAKSKRPISVLACLFKILHKTRTEHHRAFQSIFIPIDPDCFRDLPQMGTQKMNDEDYLDPQGAAKFTKRSKSTLDKLRCSGNGPRFIRAGRKILYRRADLVAWLDGNVFTSTSEYGLK